MVKDFRAHTIGVTIIARTNSAGARRESRSANRASGANLASFLERPSAGVMQA